MDADDRPTVVIDALAARFGGTAYALIQLAHALVEGPEALRVVVIARADSIVAQGVRERPGLELRVLAAHGRFELLRRTLWQVGCLRRATRGATGLISFSGIVPRAPGVPTVSYLLNPVAFERRGAGNRLRRWAIRRTVRRPGVVLTPSTAMAALVTRGTGIAPRVVPLGVAAEFSAAPRPGADLLCVADLYDHKRHDVVIRAWRALPEPRPRLRLIGNPEIDPAWRDQVLELAAGEVDLESGLSVSQLADAYRSARVFILPSTHESFSMPVAESLMSGVPAVLAEHPVLRETGGPGATFVASEDPHDWAESVRELLADDDLHGRLRALGLEHAQRYTVAQMDAGVRAAIGADDAWTPTPSPWRPRVLFAAAVAMFAFVLVSAIVSRESSVAPAVTTTPGPAPVSPVGPAGVRDDASYGSGLRTTAPDPAPALRQAFGPRWRVLAGLDSRLTVTPQGRRSKYFSMGIVAWPLQAPARIGLLTSTGERGLEGVARARSAQVLTFGPLKAPRALPVAAALSSVEAGSANVGPRILISPIEARFLAPGEAVERPRAVQQAGPGGIHGIDVPAGKSISLRITPGMHRRARVVLRAVTLSGDGVIAVDAGAASQRHPVPSRAATIRVGPVAGAVRTVAVRVLRGDVLIGPVRLAPLGGP